MRRILYRLSLILFGLGNVFFTHAQDNWKSKGPLYQDQYLNVEIEYALSDACGPAGAKSQYRYRITRLKDHGSYYINWRFDYFDCDHQLKSRAVSLHIGRETKAGIVTPEGSEFSALKIANNFNDVKKSMTLPPVTAYEPRSTISLEPKTIVGNLAINKGSATTLSLLGGYLAPNSVWKWYEGNCNGTAIGNGPELKIQPSQTTTYALRAEGQSPTSCIFTTVTVSDVSLPADAISGKAGLCEGEKNIRLTVIGGKLAANARWVWYENNCEGVAIGSGQRIEVSPLKTTVYYVRAEGPGGNTDCRAHILTVAGKSRAADRIGGTEKVGYGDPFTLTVQGGELAPDAKWVWYAGSADNKSPVGTGNILAITAAIVDQTYYVRAEGTCYTSEYSAKTVRLAGRPATVRSGSSNFFLNVGVVAQSPEQVDRLKNFVVTAGGGQPIGWFVRAKISSAQSGAVYETSGTQITNYYLPGYYQYNGQIASKRSAYTGGFYFGGRQVAVYLGGGYGTRELIYGIDQYAYGNSVSTGSSWVKLLGNSYTGAEIEGGLILKIGSFQLMGGVSTIQGKYTDYNLGIGLNF
jgi:hypothetical protein